LAFPGKSFLWPISKWRSSLDPNQGQSVDPLLPVRLLGRVMSNQFRMGILKCVATLYCKMVVFCSFRQRLTWSMAKYLSKFLASTNTYRPKFAPFENPDKTAASTWI
jgi:hypothetical protein